MNESAPPERVKNLVDMLRWRAEVSAPEQGFRFLEGGEGEGELRSFSALEERARAIGARIREIARPGERALLLYPPSLAYIEAFFGCLYAGVIAVPVYPPDPRRLNRTLPRLQAIVKDSGSAVALTTSSIASMATMLGAQAPMLEKMKWLATDEVEDEAAQGWRGEGVEAETVAFLQYTSGSTGAPKGVILDHGTLLRNQEMIREAFKAGVGDVGVNWLPLYHDMGLIGAVIQPVYCGCDSVLMSPLDFLKRPRRWVEAISRFGGTMSTGPNFGYDLVVQKTPEAVRDALDLSTWKVACNGAEPVRMATMERFAEYFAPAGFEKKAFMPAYGLAEVGLIVSAKRQGREARGHEIEGKELVASGRALGDFEIQVVDPETKKAVRERDIGEVWLRNGSVARGYWGKPEASREVFEAYLEEGESPYLRTGDLGAMVGEELVIAGRLKDLIIIRGVNHYPQDIEATVEAVHPALRPGCGAAFSVDRGDGEVLVVVQEVSVDAVEDVEGLVAKVSDAIAKEHHVVVEEVVLIEARSIEKTSSGKIQRFASRDAYLAGELAVVARGAGAKRREEVQTTGGERSAASAEIRRWLVRRVAEVAEIDEAAVDLNGPFSAYGVDSAEAVGIVGELEEWLGLELEATALYDFPTISALAVRLSEGNRPEGFRSFSVQASVGVAGERADTRGGMLAIVGMGCRFPGANGVRAYWELMCGAEEAVGEVPSDRWGSGRFTDSEIAGIDASGGRRGGFLADLHEFDGRFYGISAGEARAMDPQQKLVMTTAWQALQDAGMDREAIAGSLTGVFIGQSGGDFARIYDGPLVRAGTGMAPSITANRLSYWLNLHGPSIVVDTACSSSLVALDQALLNLRSGRCDMALVGGVNAILAPDMTLALSQARMLSQGGQCRPFDADADGYVRGEGCGVVVVKRLEDALRDGDRIRAVVRGGAVNQDGQTNGLTAPSSQAQRSVIEAGLADAGLSAREIGLVEAHGTGTQLGDAIEARALREVFQGGKSQAEKGRERIWLGSVKAQIGHLEACSGMASLIKVSLMLDRGEVLAQVNFNKPNTACRLEGSDFQIPRERMPWPGRREGAHPRRAGISAYGYGGTNAHYVLEEPPSGSGRDANADRGE